MLALDGKKRILLGGLSFGTSYVDISFLGLFLHLAFIVHGLGRLMVWALLTLRGYPESAPKKAGLVKRVLWLADAAVYRGELVRLSP